MIDHKEAPKEIIITIKINNPEYVSAYENTDEDIIIDDFICNDCFTNGHFASVTAKVKEVTWT